MSDKKDRIDVLLRDEVLNVLWALIHDNDSFESRKAFALAYVKVRGMAYHLADEDGLK